MLKCEVIVLIDHHLIVGATGGQVSWGREESDVEILCHVPLAVTLSVDPPVAPLQKNTSDNAIYFYLM